MHTGEWGTIDPPGDQFPNHTETMQFVTALSQEDVCVWNCSDPLCLRYYPASSSEGREISNRRREYK